MKSGKFNRKGSWIKRWWVNYQRSNPLSVKNPLPNPETPMIKDVESEYVVVVYHGQKINLHKSQVATFNNLNREQKRKIEQQWASEEKKGRIKFIELNGKYICVKNRDYEERAERKAAPNIQ